MELISVAWFFGGLVTGFLCCHLAYKDTEAEYGADNRTDKGQSGIDSDIRLYVPNRDRDRGSDQRDNQFHGAPETDEEIINGLRMLRLALTNYERVCIEKAIEKFEGEDK